MARAVTARQQQRSRAGCLVHSREALGAALISSWRAVRQIVRRGCFPPEDAAALAGGPGEVLPGGGAAADAGAQQLPGVTKARCWLATAAQPPAF
jgi:hypothetical protein